MKTGFAVLHFSCLLSKTFFSSSTEHRNMPSDDAMSLVARNFERYLQVLKEKNAGHAATAAPSTASPSQSITPPLTETLPPSCPSPEPNLTSPHQQSLPFLPPSAEIRYLLDLLADSRYLTLEELDKVLDYLNERKRELSETSQPSTSKGKPIVAAFNFFFFFFPPLSFSFSHSFC